MDLHLNSGMVQNYHQIIQRNFIGQFLVGQLFDGGTLTWNHAAPAVPYLHLDGRSISGGSSENRNMTGREYRQMMNYPHDPYSISSHQPIQQHHGYHLPPHMQGHNFNLHPQLPTTLYGRPTNNILPHSNLNRFENDMLTRRPFLPSGFRRTNLPPRRVAPQAVLEEHIRPRLRILPEEGVAVIDLRGSGNNFIDHHSDIDHMSYEGLLLLEERIGSVDTGLTELAISRQLKTRTHAILDTDHDAEICIICQDEYKDLESIGSLDCGHEYHSECIKTWLLVKNVCPICKASGLNVDR